MSYQALNKYKQNTITTSSPEELTLMLYEGAIKFMNIGKYSIENKDIERTNSSLIRAQNIISELNFTLNMDYEISAELRELYDFILSKLIDGNIEKDVKSIEEALEITYEMRDTWKEAMKQVKQQVSQAK